MKKWKMTGKTEKTSCVDTGLSERKKSIIFLAILVSFTLLVVFGRMYMNESVYVYKDIGADTKTSYLPYYNYLVKNIQDNNFDIWSAESGLGDTIYAKSSLYADPLIILVILSASVLGESTLPFLLLLFKVVTIILSAVFCYKFLELFSKRYNIIALVSYIYAFHGFSIIWGQHYFFSPYSVYTIIIIFLIERFLQKKKAYFDFPLIFISFLAISYSPYLVYMVYFPMIFYALVRYIQLKETFRLKPFFVKFTNLGLNIILGFVSGMLFACGPILTILYSGRLGAGESKISQLLSYFKQWISPKYYLSIAQRFLSGNYWGVGNQYDVSRVMDNYYEAPQLFFTIFFWILLFQFLFTLYKKNRKNIIISVLTVIIVFMVLSNYGMKYILYACSGICARYTFVLFPLFALMFLRSMENILYNKIYSKSGYILAVVLSIYLLIEPYLNLNEEFLTVRLQRLIVLNIILFVLGTIVLVCLSISKNTNPSRILFYGFAGIILLNVTMEMHIATNREGIMSKDEIYDLYSDNGTRKALEYLESIDDSYYRVEKTYCDNSAYTDSLFYNYKAISAYNSVLTTDIKEFNSKYMNTGYTCIGPFVPFFMSSPYDFIQYSELGVKYVLAKEIPQDTEHYELLKQIDDVYIYKNKFVNSFTTFFDQVVSEEQFLNLNYKEKNQIMQTAVTIEEKLMDSLSEYAVSIEECKNNYQYDDLSEYVLLDDKKMKENTTIDVGEITFKKDLEPKISGNLFIEFTILSEEAQNVFFFLDTGNGYHNIHPYRIDAPANEECHVRYLLPKDTKAVRIQGHTGMFTITGINVSNVDTPVRNEKNPSVIVDQGKDSHIEGRIESEKNGILLIPITYDSNWKATVDGKEVKLYKADKALMAIEIEEGNHTFVLDYENKFFYMGSICFVVSIILCLVYVYISKKLIKCVE